MAMYSNRPKLAGSMLKYNSNTGFYRGRVKPIVYRRKEMFASKQEAEIRLNGFEKLFHSQIGRFRKINWFFILVTLTAFSSYQIFKCFEHFLHQHAAVKVDYVTNATILPPCIIVCPLIMTRNIKLIKDITGKNETKVLSEEFFQFLDGSRSVEEIWELSDMVYEELTLEVIEGLSLTENWIIDKSALKAGKVSSTSGTCIQIHAKRNIKYNGLYTFIRIRNKNLPYDDETFLQVSVQTEKSSHVDRLLVAKQGIIIPMHAQVNLQYTLQQLKYLNTAKKPCSDDSHISPCIDDCVDRIMHEKENVQCKLPFMEKSKLPSCSTPEDFRMAFEAADRLMSQYSLEKCKCPRYCNQINYNLKAASELHVDEDIVINLNIYFPDNSIERITEYNTYDLTSLLSDVGGTLGLYLGICLITLIEILETIGLKFLKICNFVN